MSLVAVDDSFLWASWMLAGNKKRAGSLPPFWSLTARSQPLRPFCVPGVDGVPFGLIFDWVDFLGLIFLG